MAPRRITARQARIGAPSMHIETVPDPVGTEAGELSSLGLAVLSVNVEFWANRTTLGPLIHRPGMSATRHHFGLFRIVLKNTVGADGSERAVQTQLS